MDKREGICVGVRIRPKNSKEEAMAETFVANDNKVQHKDGDGLTSYEFDKVFDTKAHTMDVYEAIGKSIVEGVAKGINGTIFAYGQTGSGKTHTMLGNDTEYGILTLAASGIWQQMAAKEGVTFQMKVSFVEIYNEVVRDLLVEGKDKNDKNVVEIREDPERGVYANSTEINVAEFGDIMNAVAKGNARRAVEATQMNATSSRSHSIFKLVLETTCVESGTRLISALNLVDLAGSENAKQTHAEGQRAKEGGKINQSLLSLSLVINALARKEKHVGFRDSKLTRLLQTSLSGDARMSILCCISPAANYSAVTLSTLNFAKNARNVTTHAKVNEVVDVKVMMARLTKELEEMKQRGSSSSSGADELQLLVARMKVEIAEKDARLKLLNAKLLQAGIEAEPSPSAVASSEEVAVDFDLGSTSTSGFNKRKKTRDTWCPRSAKDSQGPVERVEFARFSPLAKKSRLSEPRVGRNDRSSISSCSSDCSTVPDDDNNTEDSLEEPNFELENSGEEEQEQSVEESVEEEEEVAQAAQPSFEDQRFQQISDRVLMLMEQFAIKDQTIHDLQSQLINRENVAEELAAARESLARAEQRAQEAEEAAAAAEELRRENESLASQVENEVAVSQELEKELEELRSSNESLSKQLSAARTEVEAAQATIASVTAEKEATADSSAEVEELRAALSAAQSNLEESQQMFDTLVEEKRSLECEATAAASALEEELAAAKAALADLAGEKDLLNDSLNNALSEVEALEAKLAAAGEAQADTAEIDRLRVANEELSAQLESEMESALSMQQELMAQQSALAEVSEERDALLADKAAAEGQSADLVGEAEDLRAQVESLAAELADAKDTLIAAEKAVEALNAVIAEKESQQSVTEQQLQDLSELRAQLSAAEDTLQSLMGERVTQDAAIADLQETVRSLESEVQIKSEEAALLQETVSLLEADKAEAVVAEDRQPEVDLLQAAVQEREGRIAELTERCSALTEENSAEKARVCSLLNEVAVGEVNMQRAGAAWMEAAQTHEAEVAALAEENEALQGQVASLEAKVAQVTSAAEGAEQQLKQMQAAATAAAAAAIPAAPLSTKAATVNAMTRFNESEISQETLDAVRRDNERQIESMRAELGHKDGEVSRLRASCTEWQTRASVAEQTLNANSVRDNQSVDGDEAMRKRLGQLQTTVDLLKGERDTMAAKFAAAEAESKAQTNQNILYIQQLEKRVNSAAPQHSGESSAASDKEVQEANQRLRKAKDECAMLNGELAAQGKMVDRLADEVDSLKQKLGEAQEAAAAEAAKAAATAPVAQDSESDQLREDLSEARNQVEELSASNASLEEAITEYRADAERLSEELAAREADLDAARADRARLEAEVAELVELADLSKQTEAELTQELEVLRRSAAEPKEEKEAAVPEGDSEELAQQLADAIETRDQLAAKLESQREQGKAVIEGLNQRIAALTEEVEALVKSEADLEAALESARTSTMDFAEINELSEDLEAARQREQDLESRLDSFIRQKAAQDKIIESLQAQMSSSGSQIADLHELTEVLKSQLSEITGQFDESQEAERAAAAENQQLKTALVEQEDLLAEAEGEVAALRERLASQDGGAAASSEEVQEQLQEVLAERELLEQKVAGLGEELEAQREQIAQLEESVAGLTEQCEVKDKRIAHLDACKLTKDQMEKIKVIKEEHRKYKDDAKMLKKQLQQLKSAYDELKTAGANPKTGPSTEYVISDLKFQLVEMGNQVAQEQKITALLKDKLKECSKQLQEHEKERSDVIALLEKHGIDTVGLVASLDTSLASADAEGLSRSTLEHQVVLADAVGRLAEKLTAEKQRLEKTKRSGDKELDGLRDEVNRLGAEVAELGAAKKYLEKQLEKAQGEAKAAAARAEARTAEAEELRASVDAMKSDVDSAEKKAALTATKDSSLVEALESELIELQEENKSLRIQVLNLKDAAPARSAAPAPAAATAAPVVVAAPTTPAAAAKTVSVTTGGKDSAVVGQKRTFGANLTNAATIPGSASKASAAAAVDKPKMMSTLLAEGGAATEDASPRVTKAARTKAKPVVEDTAECTQS